MRDMISSGGGSTRIAVLSSAGAGGGGIAAHRLAQALDAQDGLSAEFLTAEELGGFLPEAVVPSGSKSNRQLTDTHFTVEYPGYRRDWLINLLSGYDIVNVHWASYLLGLAELETLAARGTRMLFMLHDYHYFTGGCHYPAGCTGMARGCLGCPQVDSSLCDSRFIPVNLRVKRAIFAHDNVHLAAPSGFLRDQAVSSGIVSGDRAHVLRNAYAPLDTGAGRPDDDIIRILLIADSLAERRKGMPLALDSLAALHDRLPAGRRVQIDVVGQADPMLVDRLTASGLTHVLHGRISDHARLVGIFAASDIVLSCSYEDNWPNILVEAGAYGCVPVVGPGHGCAEFSETYGIGGIARNYTADAFADALMTTISGLSSIPEAIARIRNDHRADQVAAQFLRIAAAIPRAQTEQQESHA